MLAFEEYAKQEKNLFDFDYTQGVRNETKSSLIDENLQSTPQLTHKNEYLQNQNATKDSLNKTLQEAYDIFKKYNKDESNDKLFDKVIEVANKLDVRYWEQINPKYVNGTYTYWLNRAMIDTKLLKTNPEHSSQTILHELIHSVSSRAIHAYDNGLKDMLTQAQIQGIEELKNLYKVVLEQNQSKAYKIYATTKETAQNNIDKIYGLANEHEFLAELANKDFRDFLKEQNLWARIIQAIAKIFGYTKKQGDEIATNAYKEAQNALEKIMDNYKPNFTRDFDDMYKKLDFIDFANYKDYLKKHSQRVKNFVDFKKSYFNPVSKYIEILAEGGNGRGVNIGEAVFEKTLGVKNLDELETTPITEAIKEIINGEQIFTFYAHKGDFAKKIKAQNDVKIAKRVAILTGLMPFIRSGLYKQIDDNLAKEIIAGLKDIASKDLRYRGKPINDFFAKDFADKQIDKITQGVDSFDTINNLRANQNPKNDKITAKNIQGQNTMKLDKFLDSKGKMSEESLRKYAINIPPLKFNNPNQFKTHFAEIKGKFGIVKTPYKNIEVDIPYAYRHFYKNTNNKNRNFIKGAFFETFRDPLFIAKDNSKGKESVYFYKPFLDKYGNFVSLFGIGIDAERKVNFKTFYKDDAGNRLREMDRLDEANILYVK